MPSRDSFSIRKLFSSPRRLSLIADEVAASPTFDRVRSKRRSDSSSSSGTSNENRIITHSRGSSGSSGSSNSTIFHPDSSISITTPQAERGLTDNVDHELSQEEIDRIKAVVAAAAAAAARSLRLRMDADSEAAQSIRTIQTIKTIETAVLDRMGVDCRDKTNATSTSTNKNTARSECTESAVTARLGQSSDPASTNEPPPVPRKKNRPIPPAIVVPPRSNTPRTATGVRVTRREKRVLAPDTHDKAGGDKHSNTERIVKTERVDKGDKSDRNGGRNNDVDKRRKSQHRRVDSQGRRGSLGAKSGKSQQHLHDSLSQQRKSSRSGKGAQKQKQHEAVAAPPTGQAQLAAGNSKGQIQPESDKRHTQPKHSQAAHITQTTAKKQPDKQSHLDKDGKGDKQKKAGADVGGAAWRHGQHRNAQPASSVSSTSTVKASSSRPNVHPLTLDTTVSLASTVPSRTSLSAHAPNLLTKALPPPPPPRVSSFVASHSSWKPKTENASSSSSAASPDKTVVVSTKSDAVAHPLYRGRSGDIDCKKDSGIALDRSQTNLVGSSNDNTSASSDNNNVNSDSDSDYGSDAGSCIDLLQALSIPPEEAALLRRPPATESSTQSASMQLSSSRLAIDSDTNVSADASATTDSPVVRNVCTTPTFTQPRMAPTPSPPAVPSIVPSEATISRRMMSTSPSPTPRPSLTGGESRTSGASSALPASTSPSSPKRQTRFLPLRLNKGLPDAALRIKRKRSKDAAVKRDRAAAASSAAVSGTSTSNKSGQPFVDGKSQMDVDGDGTSNSKGSKNSKNSTNNNANTTSTNSGGSGGSGSSRWTLPDNVTELFNGRLFSRMEVTETLPFEKLQAIRASRALAQKQQVEADEKKKAKQMQEAQDEKERRATQNEKQQQELADAERALIKELQRPHPQAQSRSQSQSQSQSQAPCDSADTTTAGPLETLLECEEEELQVSPLEPDDMPVDAHGNPIEPTVFMPVSPPTESYPSKSLPMPPHIATQMVWRGGEGHADGEEHEDGDKDEEKTPRVAEPSHLTVVRDKTDDGNTKTRTVYLSASRDEPDGSTTPIEPFHMEDLPSRIGAAGVRESILLPVEEEEAYFASSVAQHKERRRREREAQESKEKEAAAKTIESESESDLLEEVSDVVPKPPKSPLDEIGPFPSPPTKNPMRFQSFIRKVAQTPKPDAASLPLLNQPPPTQPIPQVTVTDVDRQRRRRRAHRSTSHKSLAKTPKSSFFLSSPTSLVPPLSSSSLSTSSSATSMTAVAGAAASTIPQHRDDTTYVYLSATPFSLVMPTYRHGPVRLNRLDLLDVRSDSRSSYDRNLHLHRHHHPNIATVEETLDWTAFQMAILGGAGEYCNESIDYGQISAAAADEADRLADWFWSLDIPAERLLTNAEEDTEWVRPVAPPSEVATAPATMTQDTQRHKPGSQWPSIRCVAAGVAGNTKTNVRGLTHSRTATDTSIGTTTSVYSSCGSSINRDVAVVASVSSSTVNTVDSGLTAQTANQALPFPMSRNNSTDDGAYAMSRNSSTARHNPAVHIDDDITPTQPRTIHNLHPMHAVQDIRASYASVASYESMPQSPMADLIMTRGANGKEYVAPMGYNLSHDLGDYLQWEKDNVYAMALDEPR
ncbi:uncharacterized protein SPSK_02931 [Sporothrix schenckii 1099-18]|uniref:Uncharacterized protein n=1 Tax=Sporothrix schenckii 1099-18 TaxID=1397361 RepID=A0A0F2LXI3_SPOSC|nr:uncharacterized protein SPSK_02931 [Sporothrix schenckii 1099-18]KJR82173.1 hypothetical protein SPSK_02931 [Sporothrix schenckii 1099-18]